MKRLTFSLLLMLFITGIVPVMAQQKDDKCPSRNGCTGVIIVAPATPEPPADSDGDGLPDSDDGCPGAAGPRENGGCPVASGSPNNVVPNPPAPPADSDGDGLPDSDDGCPNAFGSPSNKGCPPDNPQPDNPDTDGDGIPDSSDPCPTIGAINGGCPPDSAPPTAPNPDQQPCTPLPGAVNCPPDNPPDGRPPFVPPALPADGCFVTSMKGNDINVRKAPNTGAKIIGFLKAGTVYAAEGYVMNGTEIWFVMTTYEGSTGAIGYASRTVLLASPCMESVFQSGEMGELTTHAVRELNGCEDDFTIWWIIVEAHGAAANLHDVNPGNCSDTFDQALEEPLQPGMARLVASRDWVDPIDLTDCDENGIPDLIQSPAPLCSTIGLTNGDTGEARSKEYPDWWAMVLNLTCGGSNWIIMTEIDSDGEEVATDAQCEDDL